MNSSRDIWAVVPFKGFATAKQRLAPTFSPACRRDLACAMLEDVLDTLLQVPELAGILLVTRDREAAEIAAARTISVFEEQADQGHNAALTGAAAALAAQGCGGMLVVPADIPAATASEISRFIAGHPPGRAFSIAPAHDGKGSNAVINTPPDCVTFAFGPDSFHAHLDAARASGLKPAVMILPGVGRDIDTPADCWAFMRNMAASRSRSCLERHGLSFRSDVGRICG